MLVPDVEGLNTAGTLLRRGKLVAIPTETVYGLAGDATNDDAVARIFEAKGRPSFNPLIIHFADVPAVWSHVVQSPLAEKLAKTFWPGPLSLILPRHPSSPVSLLASAGLDTLAVRVPAHPIGHAVLKAAGCPVAAPSANESGGISPTQPHHVRDSLGNKVDAIMDGGACDIGIESTVVAVLDDHVVLLRPGSITRDDIKAEIDDVREISDVNHDINAPRSPGMLKRHYAPRTKVRLNVDVDKLGPDDVVLGFGPVDLTGAPSGSLNLSAAGDLKEAAANLFSMLRRLDCLNAGHIAIMPIPEIGLGVAINDRLRRAATPESQ